MIETQGLSPYSLLGIWDNDCATRINETPTPLKALKINHCPIVQNTHHPQGLENQSLSHCPRLLYREEEKNFFYTTCKEEENYCGTWFFACLPACFSPLQVAFSFPYFPASFVPFKPLCSLCFVGVPARRRRPPFAPQLG
jgi:hypothetical protein